MKFTKLIKEITYRELQQGQLIPRGYGLAFKKWELDSAIFTVIPLNLILRYSQVVFQYLTIPVRSSKYERQLREQYYRGYSNAMKEINSTVESEVEKALQHYRTFGK